MTHQVHAFALDAATLAADAERAGFSVEALPGDGHALHGREGTMPLELRTGPVSGWTLGEKVAARIILGTPPPAKGAGAPPLTVLDGPTMALWPRYVLDG